MRAVWLLLSYAMIYDTTVVTVLIITLFPPQKVRNVNVSNFRLFSFRCPSSFSHKRPVFYSDSLQTISSLRLPLHFSYPASHSSHRYPFKTHRYNKESFPHQRLHWASPSSWWEGGISWYHERALKLKSMLGIVSGRAWGRREGVLGKMVCS